MQIITTALYENTINFAFYSVPGIATVLVQIFEDVIFTVFTNNKN